MVTCNKAEPTFLLQSTNATSKRRAVGENAKGLPNHYCSQRGIKFIEQYSILDIINIPQVVTNKGKDWSFNVRNLVILLPFLLLLVSQPSFAIISNSTNSTTYSGSTSQNLPPPAYMIGNSGAVTPLTSSGAVTVTTDKPSYKSGDTIIISGTTRDYLSDTLMTIMIRDLNGNVITVHQVTVEPEKTYSYSVTATGALWQYSGTYSITAEYGTGERMAATTFQFVGTSNPVNTGSPCSASYPCVQICGDHPCAPGETNGTNQIQTNPSQQQIQLTSGGTIDVGLSTNPAVPTTQTQTNFQIEFINKSTQSIQQHIDYKISVIERGNQICGTSLLHTALGSVVFPCQLPDASTYLVIVEVNGILFQPISPETATFSISANGQISSSNTPPPGPITQPQTVTVTTDKPTYSHGDKIMVSGTTSFDYDPSAPLNIFINNPRGNTVYAGQANFNTSRTYSETVDTNSPLWQLGGKYTISVIFPTSHIGATDAFSFTNSTLQETPPPIQIQSSLPNATQSGQPVPQPPTSSAKIPAWVKNIFIWYGRGSISDDELIGAIQFLVQQGIIHLK